MSPATRFTAIGEDNAWYPDTVPQLEAHLRVLLAPTGNLTGSRIQGMIKNAAYTIQYLEFLVTFNKTYVVSDIVSRQLAKTFIVNACAVLECLFFYMLHKEGHYKKDSWLSIRKVGGNKYKAKDDNFYKMDIEVFKELRPPVIGEMNFDSMCKVVESKKLCGTDQAFYTKVAELRKLRNRIHIHAVSHRMDTDFYNIEAADAGKARLVLHQLLTSSHFHSPNALSFDYMKP